MYVCMYVKYNHYIYPVGLHVCVCVCVCVILVLLSTCPRLHGSDKFSTAGLSRVLNNRIMTSSLRPDYGKVSTVRLSQVLNGRIITRSLRPD
uniref:Uncharacterized protein n=1 Tax=Octopus bimaculoides TaxID=37653 RepID=A0A0L8GKE7_OCTBM